MVQSRLPFVLAALWAGVLSFVITREGVFAGGAAPNTIIALASYNSTNCRGPSIPILSLGIRSTCIPFLSETVNVTLTVSVPGLGLLPKIKSNYMQCKSRARAELSLYRASDCIPSASRPDAVVIGQRARKTCFQVNPFPVLAPVPLSLTMACLPAVNPTECRPKVGLNQQQCTRLIEGCPFAAGKYFKWTGMGCRNNRGRPLQDGGCQCISYCGYRCKSACNRDPFKLCAWDDEAAVCKVKSSGEIGGPISSCEVGDKGGVFEV